MRPQLKKRFGQHFLRDTGILGKIVRLIQPCAADSVVEIGAGDGSLSRVVAPKVSRLLAIEVDADHIDSLRQVLAPYAHASALHGDILQLDLPALLSELCSVPRHLRLVGNLPYNIATEIIHRLLRLGMLFRDMIFMVQLEVARRIVAPPDSRDYGYFSVDCQHRATCQILLRVSPACFVPRPQVTSALVLLRPHGFEVSGDLEDTFDNLVKAAFSHRRKTLANSLRRHATFGGTVEPLLEKARISGSRRAENLSVAEYEHLARVYGTHFAASPEGRRNLRQSPHAVPGHRASK